MRVHDDQHTERARARAEYARSVFAPTPVGSAFEVTFGMRFHDYVRRGGSPDVQAFTKHELERRLRFCDGMAAVATTVVAFALLSTTPPEEAAELSGPAGFLAAWLAAGLWLLVPAMLARRHVRTRFNRQITQMTSDRAAYEEHRLRQVQADRETARRLQDLGIDL